jgi:peptidoglycan hydrolase FlgJ
MTIQGVTAASMGSEMHRIQSAETQLSQQNDQLQNDQLRETFNEFVGQTFFSELIKSCRKTQQPSAYFHGGRAEQIFQGQLDQVLSEVLSERTASTIADPMFELFMLKRQ